MKLKIPYFVHRIHRFLDELHIPFLGVSFLEMFQIYIRGMFRNNIGRKAGAISWSFFLSLFPMLLFLVSVLPYMPHYEELQFYIFDVLMQNIIPTTMEQEVLGYIEENILPNRSSISNLTIILTLFFATNGTFALIDGFNEGTKEKYSNVKEYFLALVVTLGFISVLFMSIFGIYYSEVVVKLLGRVKTVSWVIDNLWKLISFIGFPVMYFLFLSMFYWIGTAKITRFRHALPGAFLTTVLFFLTIYVFTIYVRNFSNYNVLYGSIGSIILVMIWINVNVYLLLFGNELNLAIRRVRRNQEVR